MTNVVFLTHNSWRHAQTAVVSPRREQICFTLETMNYNAVSDQQNQSVFRLENDGAVHS